MLFLLAVRAAVRLTSRRKSPLLAVRLTSRRKSRLLVVLPAARLTNNPALFYTGGAEQCSAPPMGRAELRSGTISLHLYNFPSKAMGIMEFIRAAARGFYP